MSVFAFCGGIFYHLNFFFISASFQYLLKQTVKKKKMEAMKEAINAEEISKERGHVFAALTDLRKLAVDAWLG